MSHVRNECIECKTELACDDYTCPDDPTHDVEEIYTTKCTSCGYTSEQSESDLCIKCDEEVEDED